MVSTGYYSDRLEKLLPKGCNIEICNYENLGRVDGQFDWVLCAYTETSIAFKIDLNFIGPGEYMPPQALRTLLD